MFRPASRALLRAPPAVSIRPSTRFISSSSGPEKSRSWKNSAIRLGLALGAVYYYNTSSVFTERPVLPQIHEPDLPTLDSIKPRIRSESQSHQTQTPTSTPPADLDQQAALEEEASQEAAFDPETGEINWDCPCLGGMAHGPCGEEFKAAFSCFVYSKEEPKGMDCIDRFKGMQDCFRMYPDVYGGELEDDEEGEGAGSVEGQGEGVNPSANADVSANQIDADSHPDEKRERAKVVRSQMKESESEQGEQSESDELLPKAWHDTEEKNESKAVKSEK